MVILFIDFFFISPFQKFDYNMPRNGFICIYLAWNLLNFLNLCVSASYSSGVLFVRCFNIVPQIIDLNSSLSDWIISMNLKLY